MAESITTMLAQIAIQKGVFKDWHQKVSTILPGLKGPHASELELWHLSTIELRMEWDEAYKNPFTVTAKAYYGEDVRSLMLSLPIVDTPGTFYIIRAAARSCSAFALCKPPGGHSLTSHLSGFLEAPPCAA
jgi:hypothetical protein